MKNESQIKNPQISRSDHPAYYWDNKDECFRYINTDARIEGNPPEIKFADRRAIAIGAEDSPVNNANPEFTGIVVVNEVPARVLRSTVFNGCLHYGILGKQGNNNFCGWIPACLCEIPEDKEAAALISRFQL